MANGKGGSQDKGGSQGNSGSQGNGDHGGMPALTRPPRTPGQQH
ncbi:hypothetical protein [Actinoallomurus sp. NPDC052274]